MNFIQYINALLEKSLKINITEQLSHVYIEKNFVLVNLTKKVYLLSRLQR